MTARTELLLSLLRKSVGVEVRRLSGQVPSDAATGQDYWHLLLTRDTPGVTRTRAGPACCLRLLLANK
jgi:hypothetical protein